MSSNIRGTCGRWEGQRADMKLLSGVGDMVLGFICQRIMGDRDNISGGAHTLFEHIVVF